MHLRPATLFYCAFLLGLATLATSASNTAARHGSDHIDIDAEVEGSGIDPNHGDTEGSASSGMGGIDDDDDDDGDDDLIFPPSKPEVIVPKIKVPDLIQPPKSNDDIIFDKTDKESTTNNIIVTTREEGHISFFAQPGILAAIIGGALVGLLCAILVVMFIVYRMRKKDEGSYAIDERKRSSTPILYGKGDGKELYA